MDITKVIILSGGRATRLPNSARDIPKSLVRVNGRPILEHQLLRLNQSGFTDIRLALGFRAEQIVEFISKSGLKCEYAVESEPLGTGGAIKFAAADLTGPFLVLNGDTMADFNFRAIVQSHQPSTALMVAYWKDDARDFGLLRLEGELVREFMEKPALPQGGHINAGCYILEPELVSDLPHGFIMLEEALFPKLAREGRLRTHIHQGFFEDLGTEERLARIRESFLLGL